MSNYVEHPEAGSFELWESVVRRIVGRPTEPLSLLDLCCNECTVTSRLRCKEHVGVDVVDWPTRRPLTRFVPIDVLDYLRYTSVRFDLCICSDGIEHLNKKDGFELLIGMERVADLSIIFTPLGPWMLDEGATHPDKHKSGWWPHDLTGVGWHVEVYPKWHPLLNCGAFFAWKGGL